MRWETAIQVAIDSLMKNREGKQTDDATIALLTLQRWYNKNSAFQRELDVNNDMCTAYYKD